MWERSKTEYNFNFKILNYLKKTRHETELNNIREISERVKFFLNASTRTGHFFFHYLHGKLYRMCMLLLLSIFWHWHQCKHLVSYPIFSQSLNFSELISFRWTKKYLENWWICRQSDDYNFHSILANWRAWFLVLTWMITLAKILQWE